MKKQSKSKRASKIEKREVTPTQIAFIVDRYLYDNRFAETRNLFRSEASSLLSNSPIREVPNSLMTLDDMLNDYVSLKKQKVTIDQERVRLDQENTRVQNLLQGMENVMNTFNASLIDPPPLPASPTSQQKNDRFSSSGFTQCNTPNGMSVSLLGNKRVQVGNFSTPLTNQSVSGKRKGHEASVGAPPVTRKARFTTAQDNSTAKGNDKAPNKVSSQNPSKSLTLARNSAINNSMHVHGSSVANCLFNKGDSSIPTNSACLRTQQKQTSPGSDKSNSLHKEVTPTNCTIFTKERFTISPHKQIASYTVERSHLISPSSPVKSNLNMSNKRDHVKGRLNFDDTETEMCLDSPGTDDLVSSSPSGSEPEVDLYDIDFSNLEFLSEDFSLSELLVDFEFGCEGSTNHCLSVTPNSPLETVSGSSPESGNRSLEHV